MGDTKKQYTFGIKHSEGVEKAKVPGPGAYEAKSEISKRPSSKFGKGKRKRLHSSVKVPGPGAYKAKKKGFRP